MSKSHLLNLLATVNSANISFFGRLSWRVIVMYQLLGASVVLPMRMEKFVCGVAQNMRDEDECRDSRSRSTCSSSMSHSDSQRHTANSTEDREYSREREDSWKDLPGSDIRGDRTSISIADNFTPDTTPSHKPRYFTLRNDVNNASLRHGTSIDG